jgi:hypothetical protein
MKRITQYPDAGPHGRVGYNSLHQTTISETKLFREPNEQVQFYPAINEHGHKRNSPSDCRTSLLRPLSRAQNDGRASAILNLPRCSSTSTEHTSIGQESASVVTRSENILYSMVQKTSSGVNTLPGPPGAASCPPGPLRFSLRGGATGRPSLTSPPSWL